MNNEFYDKGLRQPLHELSDLFISHNQLLNIYNVIIIKINGSF